MGNPHPTCPQCLAREAELARLRKFLIGVMRAVRDVQMPPEGPEDRAAQENAVQRSTEDKHGGAERPDLDMDAEGDPTRKDR